MTISIVVAIARNGVIGRDNGLPWHLSTDLKRFKALTLGKPIVMGRKTYESIGKPLPGRRNVVVTRNAAFSAPGVDVVPSLEDALALTAEADEAVVIGGGEIYAAALKLADRLHVTHVEAEVEGDTTFPPIDPKEWEALEQTEVPAGERDTFPTRYVVYVRKR